MNFAIERTGSIAKSIRHPDLQPYHVHVWRAHIPTILRYLPLLQDFLLSDERIRADRFYFERDRNNFIIGRGVLRAILAWYLRCQATAIRISYGSFGKPFLSAPNNTGIFFNTSHSDEWVVYAFTRRQAVGIDIERIRLDIDYVRLANDVLSAQERKIFDSIAEKLKAKAFFGIWTRKEAYIKAIGKGLSFPLSKVEVTLRSENPPWPLNGHLELEGGPWSVRDLMIAEGYAGSLVLAGQILRLHYFEWRGDGVLDASNGIGIGELAIPNS